MITVHGLPDADFSVIPDSSCAGANPTQFDGSISIPSIPQIPIVYWNWNFDDPPSWTTNQPYSSENHNYMSSGTYSVALIVEDQKGCKDTKIDTVHVITPIQAIATSLGPVCLGNPSTFDGVLSTIGTDLYEWDFDLTTGTYDSSGVTTTHIFNSPGWNQFMLKTTKYLGVNECNAYDLDSVYVYALPQPDFLFDTACAYDLTSFTNLTPPSVINSNSGLTDGIILNYTWDFAGVPGTSTPLFPDITHTFGAPNSTTGYAVNLLAIDDNGCQNTSPTYNIQVSNNPVADITFNSGIGLEACEGETVLISDNSNWASFDFPVHPINGYSWTVIPAATIADPNLFSTTCEFINPGTYTLTLDITDANNCPGSTSVTIDIWDNPTASIDPIITVCEDLILLNNPTILTNSSYPGGSDIVQYNWNFGDLSLITPIYAPLGSGINGDTNHSYACGSYNVTLEVIDAKGCVDITNSSDIATVNCLPTANFSAPDVCFGLQTAFDATSSIPVPGSNIINHTWSSAEIPGTGTSTGISPNFQWPFSAGTHSVTLIIEDNQLPFCSGENMIPVDIHALPTITFDAPEVCEGFPTILEATSNQLGSYVWNIDLTTGSYVTGPTSNPTSFQFTNASSGHMVSVTIVDVNTCSDSTPPTAVTVWDNPTAGIDINITQNFCLLEPIQINDNSTQGSSSVNYWNWNFDPSLLCCGDDNSVITYNSDGLKTITLDIKDVNGCIHDTTADIYINRLPEAFFTTNSPICFGETVTFTNQSILGEPLNIFDFSEWEFYDPIGSVETLYQNGALITAPHDYDTSNITSTVGAIVNAQLTVTDIKGCTSIYNTLSSTPLAPIEIHPLPNVSFTVSDICEGEDFIFEDKSYMNSSIFPLDDLTNINTDPFINPIFNYNGLFNSNTGNMNGGSWTPPFWTLPTTNISANAPIGVPVILIRETDFSCTDSETINAIIKLQPNIDFDPPIYFPMDQCGTDVEFSLFNKYFDTTVDFDFEYTIKNYLGVILPEPNSNSIDILNYNFDMPGIYTLEIMLDNYNGCIADSIYTIYINPNPVALFTANPTEGCEDLTINFNDSSSIPNNNSGGIVSEIIDWRWDFDTLQNLDNGNTSFTFNSVLSPYEVQLTVTTDSSCTNTSNPTTITVYPSPIPIIDNKGKVGPGLYNFDGSESTTSTGQLATIANFRFIWIVNGVEQEEYEDQVNIDYQFASNSTYQSEDEPVPYEVCLLLIDRLSPASIIHCDSIYCIELYVDYFKGFSVPSALAPNGNSGEPAEFKPKGKSLKEYNLQIFDRWGNVIWQTTKLDDTGKPEIGWDGTSKGIPVPQGTYVWRIYAKFSDGNIWPGIDGKTTGPIYLIR